MDKETKTNEYVGILDSLERIRKGIVEDNTATLAMTGMLPDGAKTELSVLLDITASVFTGFGELGLTLVDKGNFIGVTIADREFLCPKAKLGAKQKEISVVAETEEPAPVASEPVVEAPAEAIKEEPVEVPTYEEVHENDVPTEEEVATEDLVEQRKPATESEEPVAEVSTVEEVEEEVPETSDEEVTNEPESSSQSLLNMIESPVYEEPEPEKEVTYEETISAPAAEEIPSATVIGDVKVSATNHSDFFTDEQSKRADEFVYMYSKISVRHVDKMGGGKPEEMLVMIAPLKLSKYECSSVPIVVTIVHRGKQKTVSSYDVLETGKNIVQIDMAEFYFLCRGAIDSDGNFKATIVTSGISASQGDQLTILSSKTYGDTHNRETRNGHIKFRYDAEAGDGVIEVFPFGNPMDEDFVALVRNREFIDYYLISKTLKTQSKAIVYSKGGISNELICHWEGDVLEASLI